MPVSKQSLIVLRSPTVGTLCHRSARDFQNTQNTGSVGWQLPSTPKTCSLY
ncbi:hypothetical protein [Komarekiella delphini-convector]|uniref:hypothetical protein n=1 Tax=Komarekiella delphini-convector TaxID=3050158 RepID=UPI00177E0EC2|nr:hypothetical protein [Komarekiella delphini-convector]